MPASSRPLSRASDAHHDPFLIRLRAGQHRQAAAALTASHADYPASRAVFAGPERRARALHAFFATTVRDAIDHGLVDAMRTDGVVEGVAV